MTAEVDKGQIKGQSRGVVGWAWAARPKDGSEKAAQGSKVTMIPVGLPGAGSAPKVEQRKVRG